MVILFHPGLGTAGLVVLVALGVLVPVVIALTASRGTRSTDMGVSIEFLGFTAGGELYRVSDELDEQFFVVRFSEPFNIYWPLSGQWIYAEVWRYDPDRRAVTAEACPAFALGFGVDLEGKLARLFDRTKPGRE